ncbi:MAG: hypothetical protein ABIT47_00605 [Candidatus Paceibacterota bacterium]
MTVPPKVYLANQHNMLQPGFREMFAGLNCDLLTAMVSGSHGQKVPCNGKVEVVGVFIAYRGHFDDQPLRVLTSFEQAAELKFRIPQDLKNSLGKSHTTLIAIRPTSVGNGDLIRAFQDAHNGAAVST